jgi:hypothetical protein
MSIASDVRSYADAAQELGKSVLNQATAAVSTTNKRLVSDLPSSLRTAPVAAPAYAAVGAADLVAASVTKRAASVTKRAETVTKRAEELPSEAVAGLNKASETSRARVSKAQDEALSRIHELRTRFESSVDSAKELRPVDLQAKAKATTDGYLAVVKNLFETLTARGESVVTDLRRDPRLAKFLGEVNSAAEAVQHTVRQTETKLGRAQGKFDHALNETVSSVESTTADVKLPPARKQTPRKAAAAPAKTTRPSSAAGTTTARKTTAGKAPAKKATSTPSA